MSHTPGPADCPLCLHDGGTVVHRTPEWRVILPDEPLWPGFTRVVWNAHVAEMSQLDTAGQQQLLSVVMLVERAQRDTLAPDKVNLASLGNMVPHLHWHVIPRWRGDPRFPDAVWAPEPADAAARQAQWQAHRQRVLDALPRYLNHLTTLLRQ